MRCFLGGGFAGDISGGSRPQVGHRPVHTDGRDCRRSKAMRDAIAAEFSRSRIAATTIPEPTDRPTPQHGKVYLVGAGPGASDLVSLRGYRALRSADAILIDRLLSKAFLTELGIPWADKVIRWLGDMTPPWSQTRINQWLASQALRGKTVVRLKGGDPFVFGQADEETGACPNGASPGRRSPAPVHAPPALTSAGLPLTRRGRGRSFAVATARVVGGAIQEQFPVDSLVIMMGVGVLDEIVARLLADGWPADTPAAIVERGTLPWERHVESPLARLPAAAKLAGAGSPACIIVGAAADSVAAPRRGRRSCSPGWIRPASACSAICSIGPGSKWSPTPGAENCCRESSRDSKDMRLTGFSSPARSAWRRSSRS